MKGFWPVIIFFYSLGHAQGENLFFEDFSGLSVLVAGRDGSLISATVDNTEPAVSTELDPTGASSSLSDYNAAGGLSFGNGWDTKNGIGILDFSGNAVLSLSQNQTASQSIATAFDVGSYKLTLDTFVNQGAGAVNFSVGFTSSRGGNILSTQGLTEASDGSASSWTYAFAVAEPDTFLTLDLVGPVTRDGSPARLYVDNVQISSVPEPSALMLSSLTILVFLTNRRR